MAESDIDWLDLKEEHILGKEKEEAASTTAPAAAPASLEGDAAEIILESDLKETVIDPETEIDKDENALEMTLHNSGVKVSDSSQESSVYKSTKTFEELNLKPALLKAVYACKFSRPSSIQGAALPAILSGRNVIAQAHHGSGKTATFVLSMLNSIDENKKYPQAICVCNTRELAIQIAKVIESLAQFTSIGCYISFSEMNAAQSAQSTPITQQIVVGPPGSIERLFKHNRIDKNNIIMIVFDEADVLVDQHPDEKPTFNNGGRGGSRAGRGGAVTGSRDTNSLAKQADSVKKKCTKAQVLLFSATFSPEVMRFAEKTCPNAVKFEVEREKIMLDNIVQLTMKCQNEADKLRQLCNIFSFISVKQVIIFCNTVASAKTLTNALRNKNHRVSIIYGKLDDKQRAEAVEDFRHGRTKVLITTNLLSRGFDVPNISFVVNYELPVQRHNAADPETYAHRVGRSGRFGRNGCAINLVHDDQSRKILSEIEKEYVFKTTEIPRDSPEVVQTVLDAALEGKRIDPQSVKI